MTLDHAEPADAITPPVSMELWGGLECTVNRVRDAYFSQMDRNGHTTRKDDLERFASLGIRAIRYPVLWEKIAPDGLEKADWTWPDERLQGLRDLGITPIVGLVHHGSGPHHTSLTDPQFATALAEYAGAVAQRYPWVEYYTPVNEPLTTARFSGLYGVWYPHGRDDQIFLRALINQCRAIALSMQAIRQVNPNAKLVQTDDISKTYSTPEMTALANFYNERRWLSWDLLCGKVDASHALWDYLLESGIEVHELTWFVENPCPPDIIGVNYYITSERWLDHRTDRYPQWCYNDYRQFVHADIHASRALATPTPGIGPLLQETWERYGIPIAVTEAHIDANREDQLRWLLEVWDAAKAAQDKGVDMRAVTVWSLLGSFDWNCLVSECKGYYESGPFDVRSPLPRPTALARLMRELSLGRTPDHPVLQGHGWWRRPGRFDCPPVATNEVVASLPVERFGKYQRDRVQPILITGATGTLGQAYARICESRQLAFKILSRKDMDIADLQSVVRAIARYRPWAIINTGGYVRVDDAEQESERCYRENTLGASVLAIACARHHIQYMTFSSDLVFDGTKGTPYVESDAVAPLNIYGKSKADAERRVLDIYPEAMVIRTSAFFGPWDSYNFVTLALKTLRSGGVFTAANDLVVTPTYVPDLVHTSLDLLIDQEKGIWHLSNAESLSWADLAYRACELSGISADGLESKPYTALNLVAPRPKYCALTSERGLFMPALDDALQRYLRLYQQAGEEDCFGHAAYGGNSS